MSGIEVSERLISFLYFLPVFFMSLAVHEYAHAFTAYKFGDDTAKNMGRLTLNPFKHIDIIGSVVMPLLAFTSGFILIGWAKPVPVDRRKFKNILKDDLIVSAAGPLSNLILALAVFAILFFMETLNPNQLNKVKDILWYGIYFNVFLCFFNLLPIPPLDGSHILFDLFPNKFTAKLVNLGFYGSMILIIFIYSPLWGIFMNFVNWVLQLFLLMLK